MDHLKGWYHADLQAGAQSHHGTIHGFIYVSSTFLAHVVTRAFHIYFLLFFRLVYNYCTTVQKNSKKSVSPITGTAKSGGAELIGQELYKRLKNFLETYLIDLLKVLMQPFGLEFRIRFRCKIF